MKKTTYVLIAVLAFVFISLTVLIYAFSLTGRSFEERYPRELYPEFYAVTEDGDQDEYDKYDGRVDLEMVQNDKIDITVYGTDTIIVSMTDEVKRALGIPLEGECGLDSLTIRSPRGRIIIQ